MCGFSAVINHDLLIIRAVQERQQELVRRKISGLQRLMQCKLFVGQVESFTERLQKHAEDLFSGIRIKQVLVAHAFFCSPLSLSFPLPDSPCSLAVPSSFSSLSLETYTCSHIHPLDSLAGDAQYLGHALLAAFLPVRAMRREHLGSHGRRQGAGTRPVPHVPMSLSVLI